MKLRGNFSGNTFLCIFFSFFLIACNSGSSNSPNNQTPPPPEFVFSNSYDCSLHVTGFDSCNLTNAYAIKLDTNGSIGIMSVWKTIGGVLNNYVYIVNENFLEDFPLLNSATEQVIMMDRSLNKAVVYNQATQITSFTSWAIDIVTKTATPTTVTIPTTSIDAVYGFKPFYLKNNILYGVAKKSGTGEILIYSVNFTIPGTPVVTGLGGLDDGLGNYTISLDVSTPIDQIEIAGNLLFYHPANSTDLNGDTNRDDSEIFWVDLTNNLNRGISSGTNSVAAGLMTPYGNNLYYRYLTTSPTKTQWMKIDSNGITTNDLLLSSSNPLFFMEYQGGLYGIFETTYYGTTYILNVYSTLQEYNSISNTFNSKVYTTNGLSSSGGGFISTFDTKPPRVINGFYFFPAFDNLNGAFNIIEKITKQN